MAGTITGTRGDDVLTGTPRADRIEGLAGGDAITGRRGDDRLLGGAGGDTFLWSGGDGHDRARGGPGFDILDVLVDGGRLRLHLDALDAGTGATAAGDLQVIGVAGLEQVEIIGTDRAETLVLSSDAGILPPGHGVFVRAGLGRDHIDASRVRADTVIEAGGTGLDPGEGAVIRGSARFSDLITAGFGDDVIRTGAGGSSVLSGPGDNEVHLGRGRDVLRKVVGLDGEQHDTVLGFGGEEDVIALLGVPADAPGLLDTDGNGRLDARDGSVTAAGGDMTIDLAALPGGEGVTVTLAGRVRLDLDRIVVEEF